MDINKLKDQLLSIVSNLRELGYTFSHPNEVLPGPVPLSKIRKLETITGSLPTMLIDFYSTIGSINLTGQHPDWDNDLYPDPLYFSSFDYFLERAEAYANDSHEMDWYQECYGGFALEISPDYYHKANVSGGESYHIVLPNKDDPVIRGMEEQIKLSDYLKKVVSFGGFPGLEYYQHNWPISEIKQGKTYAHNQTK